MSDVHKCPGCGVEFTCCAACDADSKRGLALWCSTECMAENGADYAEDEK